MINTPIIIYRHLIPQELPDPPSQLPTPRNRVLQLGQFLGKPLKIIYLPGLSRTLYIRTLSNPMG